ncbi:hypothetical protein [Flavonifractor plautii]|jgi:hypothetical protein|uniref:hypothetical protein n=1 Tax=Flavonifractor plautii TaxID=292800 RepID=UPI001D0695DA|nr:hypothetical protein [Flavonifractor plautii]MCB7043054.1 hypothetical protein [Flavonifractor plautii]
MSKITVFEHLKACAEEARDYAGGLVAKLAKTATEAIEELEQAKADKAQSVAITIPATGWASDSGGDYPHYYDIAAEGVTANDRAAITIAPGSLGTAKTCGLCATNETMAGKIRVRAIQVPAEAISAEFWIEDGKE